MGCAPYSLRKSGINVSKIYVSEIDKHANRVNDANFPESIHLGCIKELWKNRFTPEITEILRSVDILVGGSPCQGFSQAGKQNNFDHPGSALFFHFVDILERVKELNPSVRFMLENVKMKKEWRDIISGFMGVEPVFINSALVCAQSRQRWYWANWPIPQPEDRGIFLKDIIEDSVDQKYYLSDTAKARLIGRLEKGLNPKTNSDLPFGVVNNKGNLNETEKATCIDANYFKGMDNHGQRTMVIQIARDANGKRPTQMQDRVYSIDGKSPALTAESHGRVNILNDLALRRLTPTECERLQGLPDGYSSLASDTQRYKMLGNGWQCDTIVHIFDHMPR